MGIRSVNRRRKDNTMAKRKRTIRQITNYNRIFECYKA